MNIYLIGYRCTGKTQVGQALARQMGWRFVDTDQCVEARAGMRIADLVAQLGWADFRAKEAEVVAEISRQSQTVAATGGGVILDPKNIERLQRTGVVVWLKARPDTITARMEGDPETEAMRPALTGNILAQEIQGTLQQRQPLYAKAGHFSVDTDDFGVGEICARIIRQLESKKPC